MNKKRKMTDKERLEEIKNSYLEGIHRLFGTPWVSMPKENVDWLIKQAEKSEYWMKRMKQHRKRFNELEDVYFKLQLIEKQLQQAQAKAERYKQALEFYADEERYKEKLISEAQCDADGIWISNDVYVPPIIYFDGGEKARQALEGEGNEHS